MLGLALAVISSLVLGAAGGVYLWLHASVAAIAAHSIDIKRAEKELAITLPGKPTIALLLGDNQRAGFEKSAGGRSDTMMLIRADPQTKTISLLSIPRDLQVPVYCPSSPLPRETTRIDYAFAWCGARGSLETVKNLTGLRINYLITVNFHGFKEIVNDLGGVWLDVDRRYYNKNVGSAATDFSNIDLQPGYQLLSGGSALAFVRFRHTDSDFYRQARQQQFTRALKTQVGRNLDLLKLPAIVSAVTHNVEVGSNVSFGDSTVLGYALFALTLPSGHVVQNYVGGTTPVVVNGADELQASPSSIPQAVYQFTHPDVGLAKAANAAALGIKAKPKQQAAPPPKETTVTVLNGSGIAGAAANTSYLLALRGYRTLLPPNSLAPNAPKQTYLHAQIYFDRTQRGAAAAARALQALLSPADVAPLPADPNLQVLDPGSMVVVVTGQSTRNVLTTVAANPQIPPHVSAVVRVDASSGRQVLAPIVHRVPFQLETPTVLERSSTLDNAHGDVPALVYGIVKGHKAVRLVFRTGGNEFWGIEETDWTDAPVLAERNFQHRLGGRTFDLYYSGSHLHMVVLKVGSTSYWVINTLLDSLSNETMLAIARGLKPF